ncbi:hypothetical protein [Dokdonia sp.]|uniref:hypothetical protein n=1 Tax=Dokdonia sp. TaxID=2024995 RepID=UPI00326657CA
MTDDTNDNQGNDGILRVQTAGVTNVRFPGDEGQIRTSTTGNRLPTINRQETEAMTGIEQDRIFYSLINQDVNGTASSAGQIANIAGASNTTKFIYITYAIDIPDDEHPANATVTINQGFTSIDTNNDIHGQTNEILTNGSITFSDFSDEISILNGISTITSLVDQSVFSGNEDGNYVLSFFGSKDEILAPLSTTGNSFEVNIFEIIVNTPSDGGYRGQRFFGLMPDMID